MAPFHCDLIGDSLLWQSTKTPMLKLTVLICVEIIVLASGGRAQSSGATAETGYGVVGDSITGASHVRASADMPTSKLALESSDARLLEVFNWAKTQAMTFVFAQLLDLSHSRLEYPEVSFTKIGTIVSGTMGINLEYTSPLLSAVKGFWVEAQVRTLSGLGSKIGWAELRNSAHSLEHDDCSPRRHAQNRGDQSTRPGVHLARHVSRRSRHAPREWARDEISRGRHFRQNDIFRASDRRRRR